MKKVRVNIPTISLEHGCSTVKTADAAASTTESDAIRDKTDELY